MIRKLPHFAASYRFSIWKEHSLAPEPSLAGRDRARQNILERVSVENALRILLEHHNIQSLVLQPDGGQTRLVTSKPGRDTFTRHQEILEEELTEYNRLADEAKGNDELIISATGEQLQAYQRAYHRLEAEKHIQDSDRPLYALYRVLPGRTDTEPVRVEIVNQSEILGLLGAR